MIGLRKHEHCSKCGKAIRPWEESERTMKLRAACEGDSPYAWSFPLYPRTITDVCPSCYWDGLLAQVGANKDASSLLERARDETARLRGYYDEVRKERDALLEKQKKPGRKR